jgi:hypothetical protein
MIPGAIGALKDPKALLGAISEYGEMPIIKKSLGFAGGSVCGAKKVWNVETEEKGVWGFIKKHMLTWGILGGIGLNIVSVITGKISVSAGENAPKGLGFVAMISSALGIGGIIASIYSTVKGIPRDTLFTRNEKLIMEGKEILDGVMEPVDKTKLPLLSDRNLSPLRYPKETEIALADDRKYFTDFDKPKQGFFVGKKRTGKTALAELITGMIVAHEDAKPVGTEGKRDVEVIKIEGHKLLEMISDPNPEMEQYKKLASAIGGESVRELLSSGASGVDLLEGIVLRLGKKFEDARNSNPPKRLVLILDEFDQLMALAKDGKGRPQTELLDAVFGSFSKFLENKNNDVFLTSNLDMYEMCGIDTSKKQESDTVANGNAEKFLGRMQEIYAEIKPSDARAKAEVIGVYLKQLAATSPDLFDSQFLEGVNSLAPENLGAQISKVITSKFKNAVANCEMSPSWSAEQAREIYSNTFSGDFPQEAQLDKVRVVLDEMKTKLTQSIVFEEIAPGYLKQIIMEKLPGQSKKLTLDSVVDVILRYPASSPQQGEANGKITKLGELLISEIHKCTHSESLKTSTGTLESERVSQIETINGPLIEALEDRIRDPESLAGLIKSLTNDVELKRDIDGVLNLNTPRTIAIKNSLLAEKIRMA